MIEGKKCSYLIKKRICRNLFIKAKSTHTYSVSINHSFYGRKYLISESYGN